MEPVLTTEIIRRLREGVGADLMEHLDLSNGLIVPRELTTVAECIKEYHHIVHSVSPLQTIDLSGNLLCGIDEHGDGEYDLSGLTKFVEVLLTNSDKRPLKKIVFYHNNFGKDGCRVLSLLISATSPTFLHDINLRSCCIDDASLKTLVSGLDSNKTIQSLDLRANDFTAVGMETLSNCLFKNKSLRRLDLSHNHFGAAGMHHLADKIAANVSLQILAVIDCGIGDEGCRHIGNMLRFNTGLSHLE
jgi:Ran GTPase-activating protein (RanGAP) involved in mRNA processing and transport